MKKRNLRAILSDPFGDEDMLTQAERDVAGCIALGYSIAQSASYAGISENAVRMRLRYVMAKLGIRHKSELTLLFVAKLRQALPPNRT